MSAPGGHELAGLSGVLDEARRLGLLGAASVDEVLAHSAAFVTAVRLWPGKVDRSLQVLDLGSGGGVPGLVVASALPTARLLLIDRRQKRADFLVRAVRRLGWMDRVVVLGADAAQVARNLAWRGWADVVTARGFGPPEATMAAAAPFCHLGSWLVVSEPPAGRPGRWPPALLERHGFRASRWDTSAQGNVAVFERKH